MTLAGCPSELALDELELGELDGRRGSNVRAHVEECVDCQARIEERAAAFLAIPSSERAQMVRAIHTEVAAAEAAPLARGRLRWLGAIAACAGLVLAVRMATPDAPSSVTADVVRPKGGPRLLVFRERGGKVSEAVSGEAFRAGDRLRFRVSLPAPGHVMIVGVEATGRVYAVHPTTAADARSVFVATDDAETLLGAVELDRSTGSEWLHLVWCEASFGLDQLGRSARSPARLATPKGCATAPFELSKVGE